MSAASSFVEQATLRIDNQASREIRTLNRDINTLLRNAKKLNGLKFDFGKNLAASSRQIANLNRQLGKLPKSRTIAINVQQNGTVPRIPRSPRNQPPAPPAPPPPGRNPPGSGRNNPGYALYRAASALGAFTVAANLATSALEKIGRDAATRDRTNLLLASGATPEQRAIIQRAPVPEGQGPIRLTVDQRQRLIQSLLGDVRGEGAQRAVSATNIAAQLERDVLPRLFAGQPDKSLEQTLGSLRELVVGMNLASSELVNDQGKLTKDAQRVLDAQLIAITADPAVTPENIKTVLANLKTSAFQLDTEALARVFINQGARGQRVGNETFRSQQVFQGTTDVKVLNNKLAELGLLMNVERNAKGNVIAGSGTAKDAELLATNLPLWLDKYVTVPMETALAKVTPETPATNAERVSFLNRMLAGASSAAKQGIIDTILGDEQSKAAISQAQSVVRQNLDADVAKSWTAQMNNVGTAFTDATAAFGASVANFVGAADKLAALADFIRDNPNTSTAAAVAGTAGVAALSARWIHSIFSGGSAAAGTGGAGTGVAAGAGTVASRFLPPVAVAVTSASILNWIDPKGNLWGLTDSIDKYVENKLGFNLSNVGGADKPVPQMSAAESTKQTLNQAVADAQDRLSFAKQSGDINLIPQLQTELQDAQNAISMFDQTFQTGAQNASTTISTGLQAGADLLTGGLAGAFSAGGDILASKISAAINNAVISIPKVAAPANTGALSPTE